MQDMSGAAKMYMIYVTADFVKTIISKCEKITKALREIKI